MFVYALLKYVVCKWYANKTIYTPEKIVKSFTHLSCKRSPLFCLIPMLPIFVTQAIIIFFYWTNKPKNYEDDYLNLHMFLSNLW